MPPVPVPIVVTPSSSSFSSSHSHSISQSHLPTAPSTSHTQRSNPIPTPTFSEHRENYHRVEFEAPLSADVDGGNQERQKLGQLGQGRFSIDLSLELERELANMESPPATPAYDATTHSDHAKTTEPQPHLPARRESLSHGSASELAPDPEILAHIVTQLRQSLADMTKERDDLVKMLAQANRRDAETQDAMQAMTDKATETGEELTAAKQKMREDEEQIVLLRAKVEESRRGLMRLQTENRRQSMAPIDVSRASSMTLSAFASPPSSKRASFVPLTGSMQGSRPGHKRVSSVSDSSFGAFSSPELTPSPNVHAFNIAAAEATLSGAPSSSRRFSGLFGRQSPPDGESLLSAASAEGSTAGSADLDAMRKELQAIKDELETAKHDLMEAKEAKEASETCVTALREFIADNNIGAGENTAAVKLPLPPTMTTGAEEFAESKKTGTGWGFKLWGNGASMDSPLKTSTGVVPHSASVAPSPMLPPSLMNPPASATPIGAAPLSRKLGGFFSSRSSISSSHSREQSLPTHQLPSLQTNAAALRTPSYRDSMYSHSDASSVAEPISPGSDINGLGTAGFVKAMGLGGEDVVVHEVTNLDGTPVRVSMSAVDLDGLR